MKLKVLLLSTLLSLTVLNLANADERREGHSWHGQHHEYHGGDGRFGWGLLGGLILGGIIANEVNGHYYDSYNREVVKVRVCFDAPTIDVYGRPMYDFYGRPLVHTVCEYRWQQVDAYGNIIIEQPPQ